MYIDNTHVKVSLVCNGGMSLLKTWLISIDLKTNDKWCIFINTCKMYVPVQMSLIIIFNNFLLDFTFKRKTDQHNVGLWHTKFKNVFRNSWIIVQVGVDAFILCSHCRFNKYFKTLNKSV